MSGKIDFNRPYGQVYGGALHTFEQDGKLFDGAGNEIQGEDPAAPAEPKAVRQSTKRAKEQEAPPASPIDTELAAQLQG